MTSLNTLNLDCFEHISKFLERRDIRSVGCCSRSTLAHSAKCEYPRYPFYYNGNFTNVMSYCEKVDDLKIVHFSRVPRGFLMYPTHAKIMSFTECEVDVSLLPQTTETLVFEDCHLMNCDFTIFPNLKNVRISFGKFLPRHGKITTKMDIPYTVRIHNLTVKSDTDLEHEMSKLVLH